MTVIIHDIEAMLDRIDQLEAENKRLREAARPFADVAEYFEGNLLTERVIDKEHWRQDLARIGQRGRVSVEQLRDLAAALKETSHDG